MTENIVRKTPSGNYMILNYAIINHKNNTVDIPIVESFSEANKFNMKSSNNWQRYCKISKSFYDKL